MKVRFGSDYFEQKRGKNVPVELDSSRLINSHCVIVGSSGVGKSHTLRKMIAQGLNDPVPEFVVFDVHGDIEVPNSESIEFSEASQYGLNPLRINPDPKYGGVRKCVQSFIRIIDQSGSMPMGHKQQAVLRNILYDVYADFGFYAEKPQSWSVNEAEAWVMGGGSTNRIYLEVPLDEKDEAKGYGARWDGDHKCWWCFIENYKGQMLKWKPKFKQRRYPVLSDVLDYANRVYEERFLGSDQKGIRALQAVNRAAKAFQKRLIEAAKHQRLHDQVSADEDLEKAKDNAIATFTEYINNIQTGRELESLKKYDSSDVLKSVIDRLENMQATGIFKDRPPQFSPGVRTQRYVLDALDHEEKKMMVLFALEGFFREAVMSGFKDYVYRVVILDELSTYTSTQDDKGDGIIGVIAREARKYGLVIWAANQTPTGIPESLITSVGVKVVLGLDERYWKSAASNLRIEEKLLGFIQPTQTMAVQLKEKGSLKNKWWWTTID